MPRGKILRIILETEAIVVWTNDDWARTNHAEMMQENGLNLWFADFPTADLPAGAKFAFTFFFQPEQRWEGRNWEVNVL
jgi:hypothetical protein